ncbi:MAG: GGDEF domain protein [Candidatus Ozemobacter sibiricus]|uniref:GGDEF domain protein n=1 Tax=Candidatus Ozemobacter sibiricus TaxID=2268124 RepID=A0A367ZUG0_9BACT|nr:MAG: GGDEF domain protein [Candidatus Ozemobacter sibiricus]
MKSRLPSQTAYLFGNLVILCLLLLGLWRGQPVWDTTLRLPNLLLILVILNTVMIFREGWPDRGSTRRGRGRADHDLAPWRRFLAAPGLADDRLLPGALDLLLSHTPWTGLVLVLFEESGVGSQLAATGAVPPQLAGLRWSLRKGELIVRHPGNLGEETIPGWEAALGPRRFRSTVTVLALTLIPLHLVGGRRGLLAAVAGPRRVDDLAMGNRYDARPGPATVALFLEAVLDLHFTRAQAGEGKFLDPHTGLLRYDSFREAFETEIERSERYNQSMTLLRLALVPFDEYPEAVREAYVKGVAAALRASLRRLDVMFCGKEPGHFVAILTETNAEIARLVAGRVLSAFQKQMQGKEAPREHRARLHIGFATYPSDATHDAGLLEKAEEALAAAKSRDVPVLAYGALLSTGPDEADGAARGKP